MTIGPAASSIPGVFTPAAMAVLEDDEAEPPPEDDILSPGVVVTAGARSVEEGVKSDAVVVSDEALSLPDFAPQ